MSVHPLGPGLVFPSSSPPPKPATTYTPTRPSVCGDTRMYSPLTATPPVPGRLEPQNLPRVELRQEGSQRGMRAGAPCPSLAYLTQQYCILSPSSPGCLSNSSHPSFRPCLCVSL